MLEREFLKVIPHPLKSMLMYQGINHLFTLHDDFQPRMWYHFKKFSVQHEFILIYYIKCYYIFFHFDLKFIKTELHLLFLVCKSIKTRMYIYFLHL